MTPPAGPSHMDCERRIVRALVLAIEQAGLREQFGVQPGGGIKIGDYNFRAPDVMIVRLPFDTENLPTGEDVSLAVEDERERRFLADYVRRKHPELATGG